MEKIKKLKASLIKKQGAGLIVSNDQTSSL